MIRQELGYARPDEFIYYFRSNNPSEQYVAAGGIFWN